jgi:Nuclease-related domain.
MISAITEIGCVVIGIGAAIAAVMLRPSEDEAQSRMQTAGAAGERRVARALDRARIPAVHDVTIRDRQGTHQIDHVAAAGDCLFVIETKTWRGDLRGFPDRPQWTLSKPGRAPVPVYNPIMQNATHVQVIEGVTRVPARSIVLMAGHARIPGGLQEPMMPLAGAIMRLTQAGPATARAVAALAAIEAIKQDAGQTALAGRHVRRMRAMKLTRSQNLWALAAGAGAAFVWLMITHPT